ncbi:hypothetical protein AB0F72_09665 [Actinoplanes sp. NPDC023936]|uniref:hypothetical protein n=1 Tax=Actinoplanes sp. NPDC023936 TaxID=3154910 RepID=UPI0033E8199E
MPPERDRLPWPAIGPVIGLTLGAVDSVVNHIPVLLGETGAARADRGPASQAAEFLSLILDAGWAWAAAAVLAGWLASRSPRPAAGPAAGSAGMLRGALAGALALLVATSAYYATDLLFDGGGWWGIPTRYWLIGSLVLGPPLGLTGALIHRPGPIGTVAALVVPGGATVQMLILPPPAESLMATPVRLTVWLAASLTVVLIVRRHARRSPRRARAVPS